jgi:hypothetical protein
LWLARDDVIKPRLNDLFCGAGGAAIGYHRAGFDIVGVDIYPQPHYPFEFHQADAFHYLTEHAAEFDAIHASPPCQRYSKATKWRGSADNHPDIVAACRDALNAAGRPWVMENIPQAPVRRDYFLCGTMFGLSIRRHRAFEVSWPASYLLPSGCRHSPDDPPFVHKHERAFADRMGCDWMTAHEGREAIPPAFTEFIGRHLLAEIS